MLITFFIKKEGLYTFTTHLSVCICGCSKQSDFLGVGCSPHCCGFAEKMWKGNLHMCPDFVCCRAWIFMGALIQDMDYCEKYDNICTRTLSQRQDLHMYTRRTYRVINMRHARVLQIQSMFQFPPYTLTDTPCDSDDLWQHDNFLAGDGSRPNGTAFRRWW